MKLRYHQLVLLLLLAAGPARAQKSAEHQQEQTMNDSFRVGKITMAITHVPEMVAFYQNVFQTQFQSFDAMGTTLYAGKLLGFNVLLCPNTLAGVTAEQNRHQFDVIVSDIDGVIARAKASGGSVRDDTAGEGPRTVTITDPDGNTTVFIQE